MGFKWKRFIIARQFAHSVLHYKIGSVYLHKENKKVEKGTEEKEASYFAAALLMPRASFSSKYKECKQCGLYGNPLLFRLGAIYKVPLEIVAFRIEAIEEMEKESYRLVTMSFWGTERAVFVFKKVLKGSLL